MIQTGWKCQRIFASGLFFEFLRVYMKTKRYEVDSPHWNGGDTVFAEV